MKVKTKDYRSGEAILITIQEAVISRLTSGVMERGELEDIKQNIQNIAQGLGALIESLHEQKLITNQFVTQFIAWGDELVEDEK